MEAVTRYEAEWHAELDEIPGKLSQLGYAFGFVFNLPRMMPQIKKREKLDLRIQFDDLLFAEGSVQAYVGLVPATQVAEWYEIHEHNLFSKNIRTAIDATNVNDKISDAIEKDPKFFSFVNSGITLAGVNTVHGTDGDILITGVAVIYGAQTIRAIAQTVKSAGDKVGEARVIEPVST
jgi:hypothetical protein